MIKEYQRQVLFMAIAKVSKINIDHQMAQIGVKTSPARLNITLPKVQMTIKNEAPTFEIERQSPSFRITRKGANEQANTGVTAGSRDTPQRDVRSVNGDNTSSANTALSRHVRSKTANQVARVKQSQAPNHHSNKLEVVWDSGEMSINWSRHSILIDWDGEFMPELSVEPKHSVEIFLRTEPYFRISVEEMILPDMPGSVVDKAV